MNLQTAKKNSLCPCVNVDSELLHRRALSTCSYCLGTGIRNKDREKNILRNLTRRIPTFEEFNSFDGAHCKNIYRSLDISWRCPGCRRSKFECLRWTMRFPNSANAKEGWALGLHKHHDHRADPILIDGKYKPSAWTPRFSEIHVCEQCNSADATAKRKLNLPKEFSFSPIEIGTFVIPTPHGWHLLNYEIAEQIFLQISKVPPPPRFF